MSEQRYIVTVEETVHTALGIEATSKKKAEALALWLLEDRGRHSSRLLSVGSDQGPPRVVGVAVVK